MYSTTQRLPRYKSFIAILLIVSMLGLMPPKRTDGFIVALIAGFSFGTLVADLIVLCALGIICGNGNGGTTTVNPPPPPGGGCAPQQGQACALRNACGVVGPSDGTIDCNGICRGATVANEYTGPSCTSAANICGMTNTGQSHCTNNSCNATKPADNLCTNQPLGPGAVSISPTVVRVGDTVTVSWDVGTNYPPNCTITGPRIGGPTTNTYTLLANERTGSRTITVQGPHQYTVTCGTATATESVIVLPNLYES